MILQKIKWIILCICLTNIEVSLGGLTACSSLSSSTAGSFCLDTNVIKVVTSLGTPGSTKYGKSGNPTGNFFFDNDGKIVTVTDSSNSPTSGYYCTSSGCEEIDSSSTDTYINSKATSLKCAYTIGIACQEAFQGKTYYDTSSAKVIVCPNSNRCTLTANNGYYIDYGSVDSGTTPPTNPTYLIKCTDNTCDNSKKATSGVIEFYLNAGLDKSTNPIIYSDGTKYEAIEGNTSAVFVDSNSVIDDTASLLTYTNIIVCSTKTKCSSVAYNSDLGIYLNAGNSQDSTKTKAQLIQCDSTGCIEKELSDVTEAGTNSEVIYYVDKLSSKLIECKGSSGVTCAITTTDTSGKYYLDYAKASPSTMCINNNNTFGPNSAAGFCSLNIISCNSSQICTSNAISKNSQFLDGDTSKGNNLLLCATFDEDFFCTSVEVTNYLSYYYINSGNTGEYPLIYCGEASATPNTNRRCIEKKASLTGYYSPDNGTYITANEGYYVNAGVSNSQVPLLYYESEMPSISEVSAEKDTYYLDASSLMSSAYAKLIHCESTKSCTSIEPNDGYYYNAVGDDNDDELSDRIIKCDKTGCNIGDKAQLCVVEDGDVVLKPGNYCYQKEKGSDTNDINFVVSEFTIGVDNIDSANQNITYTTSGSLYQYITVNPGNFPGISKVTTTLFEIRSNAITRVVSDGIYIINSKNERVESMIGSINIGKTYSMYVCSVSTQLCVKTQSCKKGTYYFDEANEKGYQCNESEISLIDEAGFYVDSSYVVNKSLTPSILKCEDNGRCVRYTPTNTYFLNSGADNTTKALIYCSSNSCKTQEATVGYYRAEFGHSGVIVCTSSTMCKISSLRYNYYLNNGEDRVTKPIIACNKSIHCETKKAYVGYYLIQENNNLLINCRMSSTCEVEEGSVGYYYDSANNYRTNEPEMIIKCYSSSYTGNVLCNSEKKNQGFYLSGSENNILIDCIGSKCSPITVENGIFRSAASIKTSVKNVHSQGRDVEEMDEADNEIIDRVGRFDDNSEMLDKESNVMMRLNEQRLIGRAQSSAKNEPTSTLIICSGGVCNELTAEELSLIPICTYNNDMCYLDNSNMVNNSQNKMIISVVAGEFCTDATRSTLYFATETIVEFNDVISGVLSTSKTVTKNCIKASSQYSSNYFTVGNSIYKVSEGLIREVHDVGYYFININKNILVYGTEIKEYNNSNVLLYKCDGVSCRIMDEPTSDTYYTDVTKRIIRYSVEDGKYSFVNKKENVCTFADNTCTPKYDIEENDFCITADGYIVVAGEKIKSRETGKCFMSTSISENVLAYSYNSVLYLLNSNAAKKVVTSGYYFAENNYYNSAEYRSFNSTSTGITLYGCINSICQIYDPQPD
ncbi:scaffoldin, partial [Neocallimastix californiae]